MDLFEQSFLMMDELNRELENSKLMDGVIRLDLVYQCCYISMEHSVAVKSLLKAKLYTSALALFRIQFESLVRAYWILFAATDEQVIELGRLDSIEQFTLKEHKSIGRFTATPMIEALKEIQEIKHIVSQLEEFKLFSLDYLNSIVHSGKQTFLRHTFGLSDEHKKMIIKQSNNLTMMVA
ncbi:DUF6988 family protein [Acinetobacter terrestris]|uniref:DUF6988 family protein n=1 Tax=Acinetobacter terrestris TaxID=2529843 RepID=UPI001038F8F9|nr:hypothetical protein [Acinetobacter terrestris]TCB54723.1 hypothetical protein E0H84_08235 [Acinetobacter terrestris]